MFLISYYLVVDCIMFDISCRVLYVCTTGQSHILPSFDIDVQVSGAFMNLPLCFDTAFGFCSHMLCHVPLDISCF